MSPSSEQTPSETTAAEVTRLMRQWQETEARLRELLGDQADAVTACDGQIQLLEPAREKLIQSEKDARRVAEMEKAILDALLAQIAVIDASGKILFVNEAWRNFSNGNTLQNPDCGVGQNYIELCEKATGSDAEQAHEVAAGIRSVLHDELPQFSCLYPCHSPDEKRWFRLRVFPLRSPGVDGAVVFHANVTDTILSQEEARKGETRHREVARQLSATLRAMQTIMEHSPDVICTFDHELRFAQLSAGCEKILGYTADELIGARYVDRVLKEDRDKTLQMAAQIMAGHATHNFENRYHRKDGAIACIMWSANWSEADQLMFCVARDVTENRKTTETLRRNEAMLSSAQRIAQFGSWELDLANLEVIDENPLLWSDEVFRIFGYQPGEIKVSNENFFRSVHPDDRERIKGAVGEAIRTGENYNIDHRIILPDETIRHVHEEGQVFRDASSGRPLKIIGIVQDISERKQKEEELRLSEQRFASAFEYAMIGKALVAPDGRWLKVNRALCNLIGYTPDELYTKTFQDITHPDDLQADLEHVRELLADEIQHYQMEKRYFHKRGHIVWALLSVSLVRDSLGHPLYFISQIQDITERKAYEQKLAEQAALIDQARDAIIQRDLDHVILFWNKGSERLYGWTEQEMIGRKVSELLYQTKSEKSDEIKQIVLAQGEWSGELEHLTKDGLMITVESRWTLLRDDHGQPQSILSINSDITERKKMESQLLRAQRMESIGTLAGGIAHDLNNLLAPIVMGVELLKHFGLTGQSLEVVSNIERSAKRGASLVKQVLSFARGEEGAHLAVHLGDVVNEIESMFHNTFPKNITLETKIAPDLWLITGDPTQIHQVFLNLCVNARDAMPDGGILSISAENAVLEAQPAADRPAVAAGRYVWVEVSDTGCGIPREIIDKIFDPFFTTKELSKGTGLGLATSLGIVRSHGGFMNVHSEVGRGSTFKIYFPSRMDEAPAPIDQKVDEEWPRGNGECILLVDDETSIVTVAKQTLEAFGYRVLTAADGAQAVSVFALNRDKVALVLTDMMPIMDGPTTIVALRQIDPRIKIIAASGLNASDNVVKATHAGVKHFLAKPYTTQNLLVTLRNVLREKV